MLGDLVAELRATHAALVSVLVRSDAHETNIDPGVDPVDEGTLFEIGSITKAITGTLLADMVVRGEVGLETRVSDVLEEAGRCGSITLGQLATHTAGLPRLAPNHDQLASDAANPYKAFGVDALLEALAMVEPVASQDPEYSNFGFQLLGHLLSVVSGQSYRDLVQLRVLAPIGCVEVRCGDTEESDARVSGYSGASRVPHWDQPLPGAGAVEMNIADLGRWIEANAWPDRHALADAVVLAQEPHWGDRRAGRGLGWRHYNGGLVHNGATGGFRSICCLVPGVAGVGVLTNLAGWEAIDNAAIGLLTRVVRAA